MKNINSKKNFSLSAGTALALCVMSGSVLAADANPFGASDLKQGYQLAMGDDKTAEGKCGESKAKEGKCGGDSAKTTEGKCGEGKTDSSKAKTKEGKCGEGKCGGAK